VILCDLSTARGLPQSGMRFSEFYTYKAVIFNIVTEIWNRFYAGVDYRIIPDAKTKGKSIGLCRRLYLQAALAQVSPLPL